MSHTAALVFLPFVLAIGIWVAWNDMRYMKIPNKAVMALLAVWLVVGIFVMPFHSWLWGWALAAMVLVVGFVLNATAGVGAGDAKFAAAMAPFFVQADVRFVLGLAAACLLGAFFSHRLLGFVEAYREASPEWASWTSGKFFPFGLALSGMLIFCLLAKLLILR